MRVITYDHIMMIFFLTVISFFSLSPDNFLVSVIVNFPDGPEKENKVLIKIIDPHEQDGMPSFKVQIKNGLDEDITTVNMQAYCSVFQLERKQDDEWVSIHNCMSRAPTRLLSIKAQSDTLIALPVSLPHEPIEPGTYRAAFQYSKGKGFWEDERQAVYSDEFQIR